MGYSPSNATMVVVGDVTADQVFGLAKQWIEPIPSHDPPPPVTTVEPEQQGERRVEVRKFAQLPILMLAFHVPTAKNPDVYPLEVLRTILLSGQSSRLYQRLVDKGQLAIGVGGGFAGFSAGLSSDPSLFTITVQPKAKVDTRAIEKSVYEEFDKLVDTPVTDHELQRARNQLLAGFYRSMTTISGRANIIGSYEVFTGDYRNLFHLPEKYNQVTAADVQRVAKKYFSPMNRTVATLVPEGGAQ